MHSNVVSPKSVNVVFQRLSFAIKKCLAYLLFKCNYYLIYNR
jgi:hypothetical protein